MSSALATVFLLQESEAGILDDLHRRFPLNRKACEISPADFAEHSHRVRIRRALQAFQDQGIRVSGIEPSHECHSWHVRLTGSMNREGSLKGNRLCVHVQEQEEYPMPLESIQQTTQMILQGLGFPTLVERSGRILVECNGISEALIPWLELGLAGPIEGMTWQDAEKWISADPAFGDHSVLEGWQESGISLETALEWTAHEVRYGDEPPRRPWLSARTTQGWIDHGVDSNTATEWAKISYRMTEYRRVQPWIDGGVSPRTARQWISLIGEGYGSGYSAVQELRRKGLNAQRAEQLGKIGFTAYEIRELLGMLENGFTVEQMMSWANLGRGKINTNIARTWQEHGLGPEDVQAWQKLALDAGYHNLFDSVDRVREWMEHDLGPEDARPWVMVHRNFSNYNLVRQWTEQGLEPRDAQPWAKIGEGSYPSIDFCQIQNILDWQDIHPAFYRPENVKQIVQMGIKAEQARALTGMFETA